MKEFLVRAAIAASVAVIGVLAKEGAEALKNLSTK